MPAVVGRKTVLGRVVAGNGEKTMELERRMTGKVGLGPNCSMKSFKTVSVLNTARAPHRPDVLPNILVLQGSDDPQCRYSFCPLPFSEGNVPRKFSDCIPCLQPASWKCDCRTRKVLHNWHTTGLRSPFWPSCFVHCAQWYPNMKSFFETCLQCAQTCHSERKHLTRLSNDSPGEVSIVPQSFTCCVDPVSIAASTRRSLDRVPCIFLESLDSGSKQPLECCTSSSYLRTSLVCAHKIRQHYFTSLSFRAHLTCGRGIRSVCSSLKRRDITLTSATSFRKNSPTLRLDSLPE